jgi:hypothetical protein
MELAPFDPVRREPDLFFVCLFDVAPGTGLRPASSARSGGMTSTASGC